MHKYLKKPENLDDDVKTSDKFDEHMENMNAQAQDIAQDNNVEANDKFDDHMEHVNDQAENIAQDDENLNGLEDDTHLKGLVSYFQKYRDTGFETAKYEATKIAELMDIEAIFLAKAKRVIRRKKHFDEESWNTNEDVNLSPEESFSISYFIQVMDQALYSLETRFEPFQRYEQTFGFLFDLKKLKLASDDSLMTSCINLEASLKHENNSDIVGNELYYELKVLREVLREDYKRVIKVLDFLKRAAGYYPNSWIAYRILLTIPVSVASAERSFSKLKLIKSYLRSSMSQERLNGLAILSIERELVKKTRL